MLGIIVPKGIGIIVPKGIGIIVPKGIGSFLYHHIKYYGYTSYIDRCHST